MVLPLLLIGNLFSPIAFFLAAPQQPAAAQQCSRVQGSSRVVTRNIHEGRWVNTGQTETRPINRVFTLWQKTTTWEEWQVVTDTTGCPLSETFLRSGSRTDNDWRGPVGY
jgi:hypothetical protein